MGAKQGVFGTMWNKYVFLIQFKLSLPFGTHISFFIWVLEGRKD